MPRGESRENLIKKIAYDIGFSSVGIASPVRCDESDRMFDKWLREQKHGEMYYLSTWGDKRKHPELLFDGVKSAICVGLNYYSRSVITNDKNDGAGGRGNFSIHAHGRDYHSVLEGMLSALSSRLQQFLPSIRTLACVDTKPVSDRTLAILAGIAWLGKNTNVISPEYGSWIFLGSLLTDLELDSDTPLETECNDCTICIDSCPSGAIVEGYTIDAGKCISYLTIEKHGTIPDQMHKTLGINVYGCDKCQSVCPYNVVATESTIFPAGEVNPLIDMKLTDLMNIEDGLFNEYTGDSAISRCGADGIRRNAKIALKNVQCDCST
jgi:epoxyqueuosine reductase